MVRVKSKGFVKCTYITKLKVLIGGKGHLEDGKKGKEVHV